MPFEKTSELTKDLNVLNVTSSESIKVRLNSAVPPDFVLFSKDRNLLKSMAEGAKRYIHKTPKIWNIDNPDGGTGFHLIISNNDMQQICKNAKLNLIAIINELKNENAYWDKTRIEPNPPSSFQP